MTEHLASGEGRADGPHTLATSSEAQVGDRENMNMAPCGCCSLRELVSMLVDEKVFLRRTHVGLAEARSAATQKRSRRKRSMSFGEGLSVRLYKRLRVSRDK